MEPHVCLVYILVKHVLLQQIVYLVGMILLIEMLHQDVVVSLDIMSLLNNASNVLLLVPHVHHRQHVLLW